MFSTADLSKFGKQQTSFQPTTTFSNSYGTIKVTSCTLQLLSTISAGVAAFPGNLALVNLYQQFSAFLRASFIPSDLYFEALQYLDIITYENLLYLEGLRYPSHIHSLL